MVKTVVSYIGASADYAKLQTWYDDRKGDLVTRDTIEKAVVLGEAIPQVIATTGILEMDGLDTTDSTHYFWITAMNGFEFNGDLQSTTCARFSYSFVSILQGFLIKADFTKIENILINSFGASSTHSNDGAFCMAANDCEINNVGIKSGRAGGPGDNTLYGIDAVTNSTQRLTIRNVMIADLFVDNLSNIKGASAIGIAVGGNSVANGAKVYNCSVNDMRAKRTGTGGQAISECYHYTGNDEIFNCIGGETSSTGHGTLTERDFHRTSGAQTDTRHDFNASEDGTAPGTNSTTSITPSDEYVDSAGTNADLKLKSTSQFTGNNPHAAKDLTANFDRDVANSPRAHQHFGVGAHYDISNVKKVSFLGNVNIYGNVNLLGQ